MAPELLIDNQGVYGRLFDKSILNGAVINPSMRSDEKRGTTAGWEMQYLSGGLMASGPCTGLLNSETYPKYYDLEYAVKCCEGVLERIEKSANQ